jgi:hypothetical protein
MTVALWIKAVGRKVNISGNVSHNDALCDVLASLMVELTNNYAFNQLSKQATDQPSSRAAEVELRY